MRRTAQSPMSSRLFSLLPQLFCHSSLLLFPVSPLTSLEERDASLLHSPAFRRSLFVSALPHNCFFLTSAKVYCFSPSSVCRSSLLYVLVPQSNFWDDGSMAGKELTNSQCCRVWICVFSTFLPPLFSSP